MTFVKVAVVGCGGMGTIHARNLTALGVGEVVTFADAVPEKAAALQAAVGIRHREHRHPAGPSRAQVSKPSSLRRTTTRIQTTPSWRPTRASTFSSRSRWR